MAQVQRKLTTILAADAESYSREMEADEVRTLEALRAARGVFQQFIARHHGRIANTAGDGLIAEFPSVVEAVQCAIEVQRELGAESQSGLRFRIGVHLGDVMVDGDDLLGEGVNLAARLQSMAEPGGILISQQVYDQVQKKLAVGFQYLGERQPKNFAESVAVYSVGGGGGGDAKAVKAGPKQRRNSSDKRGRFVATAQRWALILAVLFAIDWMTGGAWWVQWPAIGVALMLAVRSGPLFERD
ncbi:MAG: adenylate/guanylate cyclase domain-containing protein [Hyphomonadaceae bacterium]|nr:adenylate/guanylate cyclase domain-containing protein [Hyphomonadaceae bacterium]MBX3510110.1 adenylate/guanylate cyclase domain-containing protein [Hyphomonadaceae bacterium]